MISGTRPAKGVGLTSARRKAQRESRPQCTRGHLYAEVGKYPNGQCRQCKADDNRRRAERNGGWHVKRPKRQPGTHKVEDFAATAIAVNRILALHEKLERAATWWEREDIRAEIAVETEKTRKATT